MHWGTSGRRSWMISPGKRVSDIALRRRRASRRINECHRGRPASHLYYTHRATCAKAQAAHRRGPRLLASRRLRRFRSGAVEKITGDHPRKYRPDAAEPALWGQTRSGKPCGSPAVSGTKRCRMQWCAGIRGSPRQQERAEARPLYARSHRGTPATAGADAAIAHADSRHRVIDLEPPCRCLGQEGDRVRCVHRRSRTHKWPEAPRGPRRATDVGIAASLRKDGSVGVDRFGFRVTRQTAGLTFVGIQSRFVRLRQSALYLSFLLVRLGGFAADYFRGHPSALRAAAISGARCGGFGEADARLITIGELDAGRLECTL